MSNSGRAGSDADPELRRVAELLARERSGSMDEAEREELALYQDQPTLLEQAHAQLPALLGQGIGNPGGDQAWLARVQHDDALVQANQGARSRVERGVGLALIGGGWLLSMVGAPLGLGLAVVGVVLVLFSFIRARRSGRGDPYDEIRQ